MNDSLSCPLCNKLVDMLIYKFHRASEDAIIGRIHSLHPEWEIQSGACSRCVDFYHIEILQESKLIPEIGPHFPVKTVYDYVVIPTPLRLDTEPKLTGKGITICLIDSGFYPHPDLIQPKNRILCTVNIAGDAIDQSDVSNPVDDCWHGTMTSVVCAGNGLLLNGLYRGIASEANLVLLKVKNENGISGGNIAKAIRWATANKKKYAIRIINLSVTDDYPVSYKESDVDLAAEEAFSAGIVVVAAVGNDATASLKPPANSPNVIAVGGVDDHNTLGMTDESVYHSTYGKTVDDFMKPEIIAPSIWLAAPILPRTSAQREALMLFSLLKAPIHSLKNILAKELGKTSFDGSILLQHSPEQIREMVQQRIAEAKYISAHYQHVDGTSFAAPIVCSVIAQMLEANPLLTPAAVRNILLTTARQLPHIPVERQGYGVVNARAAVARSREELHTMSGDFPNTPVIDLINHRIIFYYHNDNANSVALAGSFNDWKANMTFFKKNGRGMWKTEICLLPKGTYFYKFVVDNKEWIPDPENSYREPDSYNGLNSKLMIV